MSQSYPDLSKSQKKQVVQWATKNKKQGIDLAELGQFMLDLPMAQVKKSLTANKVSTYKRSQYLFKK